MIEDDKGSNTKYPISGSTAFLVGGLQSNWGPHGGCRLSVLLWKGRKKCRRLRLNGGFKGLPLKRFWGFLRVRPLAMAHGRRDGEVLCRSPAAQRHAEEASTKQIEGGNIDFNRYSAPQRFRDVVLTEEQRLCLPISCKPL